eukprot:577328-Pyramimonas_sp.AAC.1
MPLRIQNNLTNSPFNDATPSMASYRRAIKVRRTSGGPRQESTNIRKSWSREGNAWPKSRENKTG